MDPKVEQLIRELAEKLGTTGQHLWEVLVRQAVVDGWCWLGFTAVTMALAVATVAGAVSCWREESRLEAEREKHEDFDEEDPSAKTIVMTIAAFICVVLAFIGVLNIGTIVTGFCNPEYSAWTHLIRQLKP